METFTDFLQQRLATGGFTTEDVLVSFLPLLRQVIETHQAGLVAPLEGVHELRVDMGRIWFEQAARREPRSNGSAVRAIDTEIRGGVEVVETYQRTLDVGAGVERMDNLRVQTQADQELTRPVYLPGYVAWEHRLGHHDPVTDVFSLGMILASLSCGLDLNHRDELQQFVANRGNLFRLTRGLHPVLAKAITHMTELGRSRRPADLSRVLRSLEQYRNYDVDFEYDLKQVEGFATNDRAGKQRIILSRLQKRLFEISRQNRLLHFRPTMSSLNLTQASVPLSFAAENIRPDQILTWGGKFAGQLLEKSRVCLNHYMNFAEVLYLGPILDRLRTEALRDAAELGFSQLKLAVCFLRWADLKSDPPEIYDSPLVLLPVKLTKKKGVRDTYWLEATSSEAEINPVVRHLFRQLYDVRLPEIIDLAQASTDELYDDLVRQIGLSDRTIEVNKVERPRVDLLHDKARRRLDMYRRRARVAGRGVKQLHDINYSYDPVNLHPLGLQLFSTFVLPARSHLQEILQDSPPPRRFIVPEPQGPTVEKEKLFYSLRDHGGDNPHQWEFDLCHVTLGNFRYRKMTLVRDYEELLAEERQNPAFDAAFSLAPPEEQAVGGALPLGERYQVVACDPTQASAIAFARQERSYIIQGPPGTGKSQTITNLIADFVARGKRVLFVCEKRAAIDVVFARLKEIGLDDLCCLIHDSKADKKEFVMDLKRVSESFATDAPDNAARKRSCVIAEIERELAPLSEFVRAATSSQGSTGLPFKDLLRRAVELSEAMPVLSAVELERLPTYSDWLAHRETIGRIIDRLQDMHVNGVLAHHPLASLNPQIAGKAEPLAWVASRVESCQRLLDQVRQELESLKIPAQVWDTMASTGRLTGFASRTEALARCGLYGVLDSASELSRQFDHDAQPWLDSKRALDKATAKTINWCHKLPPDELEHALERARRLEGSLLRFMKPDWWRLRKVLRRCYAFKAHAIEPSFVRVLENLKHEYEAAEHAARQRTQLARTYGLAGRVDQIVELVDHARQDVAAFDDAMRSWHELMLIDSNAAKTVPSIASLNQQWQTLKTEADALLGDCSALSIDALADKLMLVEESLEELPDFLSCLSLLNLLPQGLGAAFRTFGHPPAGLEAAMAHRTIQHAVRNETALRRFDGNLRTRQVSRLALLYKFWQDTNTATVRQTAQTSYRDQIRVASTPTSQLAEPEQQLKSAVGRGRRELAHEFSKQMRYKPIRDLVDGDSGVVIRSLKPVWLMSPLSVSDTLPLREDAFDVVIFDEASQITLEEAVPSIFRGRQIIVVGDEMQLPPTNFFSARTADEEDTFAASDEDGATLEYDLSSNSFLNHAARNLPAVMLGWHYRSRSESLISFSNRAFYQGRLLTVPDKDRHSRPLKEIAVQSPEEGDGHVPVLAERPVSFHFVQNGLYENRRNRPEAEYIAHLVRGLIRGQPRRSIGIVAFSEAQQDEIERALDRLAVQDEDFAAELEAEYEREVDGHFVGLLVKNLENIQGDERDVVIMSVCYGRGPDGQMRMNFGPINQSGGEKRLNVAFSRARHHMALVSSIRHPDITNDYNDGARCLKNYLRYAAACSLNDLDSARHVLDELAIRDDAALATSDALIHPTVAQLKTWLEDKGYAVDVNVGLSHFRCDLAVRRRPDEGYHLGILVDTDRYYRQEESLERDLLKPNLMRDFGWRLVTVLTKDFYENRQAVYRRVEAALGDAEWTDASTEGMDLYRQRIESLLAAEASIPVVRGPVQTAESQADSAQGCSAAAESGTPPDASSSSGGQAELPSDGAPIYLEYVAGSSSKFWELTISGHRYSVRFGRIGTDGQERTKSFPDTATARREALRILREKLGKGYQPKPRSQEGLKHTH